MEQIKRLVAHKIKISDLLNGEFIKKSGWEPSYIICPQGNISRVNLIGFVVAFSKNENILIVDDGSGRIQLRFFNETSPNIDVGDLVLIIGKPRTWNNETYIVPEIIKKIENKKWMELRKLELKLSKEKKIVQKSKPLENNQTYNNNLYELILGLIRKADIGGGVDIAEIISNCKFKQTEQIINNLLEEGEIFELKPGRVKILE
ncbi:hypothetical protein JXB41_04935 [Candidatus Woesearchaeota archaeon]|nr:hypothetical protein [Candidatus Woesearchaeota archaeon]